MKLSTIILTVSLALCSTGLLSGCVMLSKEKMADGSTDFNKVVEKAQNEMLLLNIVRASKRSPMYFKDFNAMRASVTYDIQTGSITMPFDKIGKGSIAPSTSFAATPAFDLTLNDSQDFTMGIMTPVSMKIFNYYWEQGWPKEMLLHLFIRRIEKIDKIDKDGKEEKELKEGKLEEVAFENYLDKRNNFKQFKEFQDNLRRLFFTDENKCTIISKTNISNIGPEISEDKISDLKDLIEMQKAGLELKESEPGNDKDKKSGIS